MDNIVYGKTEGIKKRVLEQLQSLYDLHLDQGQLISEELALLLRDIFGIHWTRSLCLCGPQRNNFQCFSWQ